MKQFSIQHLSQSATYAVTASVTILGLLFMGFFLAEPSITHGQIDSDDFTITQEITGETSFLVQPTDVTTSGQIAGLTGGNASGTTQFAVISNNSTGYTVDIEFLSNGTAQAMIGDDDASEAIVDYVAADDATTDEPTYGYTSNASAQFAYTVTSDTPSDTDDSFLNFGSACATGNGSASQNGNSTSTKCWMGPDTDAFQIVDRNTSAPTGATTTIEFDITVPSNAVPVPTAQFYTATATLTLTVQ